jgi:CubicO group peptidase (beta-lactamase class C family)
MAIFIRRLSALLLVQIFIICNLYSGYLHKAIDELHREAHAHHSDTLIVKKGDEVLYQMCSKEQWEPIAGWSMTKSFISLGIGFLYDEGKIHPDQPVSDFFQGWDQGKRSKITIRHLLNHTSGIDHAITVDESFNFLKGDSVMNACNQEIIDEPGEVFHYNNHAVNILSGVIEKLTGMRADLYIKEKLLDPLAITDYTWDIDEAGHALGMCGLHIRADDLVKLGELMLNKGVWNGKKLISEDWINQSVSVSVVMTDPKFTHFEGCGLLWWMHGENPEFFAAAGMLGQYCVIFPEEGVVAVRQHDYRRHTSLGDIKPEHSFRSFFNAVKNVIKEIE